MFSFTWFPHFLETPGFFLKFPGPGVSWKMSLALESPGICSWVQTNQHGFFV